MSRLRDALGPDWPGKVRSCDPDDLADCRIGPYQLLGLVGAGGMGAVWRARRVDDAFERTVAIKLIKRGMDSDEILRRFRLERQVLARLEHPNIARLYDGGAAADGRPYLVMECIEGVPINEFCAERRRSVDEVLDLVRTVCGAVHFAHANLVIHRDIKPGNVLVTKDGRVKLLDFGIAKLLDDDGSSMTVTNDRPVLTPRYASPEQIRGERLTTATDVYSLGVLLYELLTGRSPYEPHTGSRQEIERAVLGETPASASLAVSRSTLIPPARRSEIARRLRGDLDAIIARSLQKQPGDRYYSAEQLGEDLRRTQEGLPLLARGAGPLRRVMRSVRRNRKSLIATTAIGMTAVILTAVAMTWSFMAPRWAQDHVREAHRLLLTPEFCNEIWVLTFNNDAALFTRERPPDCPPDIVADVLERYDAALRLDTQIEQARLERETVSLAHAISNGGEITPGPELRRAAPMTVEYARQWAPDGVLPQLRDAELDQASMTDLRCLGLLAMLCRNQRDCLRAWSRLGDYEKDPLVEALLGVLYLALDAPERAYPRLLSAYRAFPELGFLCTYLADAALRSGDLAFAQQLIRRAETLEHLDPLGALQRVRMQYLLATGQEEAAERIFVDEGGLRNYVTCAQYARHYFDSGRRRRALAILGNECGATVAYRRPPATTMRALFEMTQQWWRDLDDSARAVTFAAALDESCDDAESLFRIVRAYRLCVERVKRFHAEQAVRFEAGPLASDPLLETVAHDELQRLYDRLDVDNAYRWGRLHDYPPELREQQLDAWLKDDEPGPRTHEIDQRYAEWSDAADRPPGWTKFLPTPGERAFGLYVDMDGDDAIVGALPSILPLRRTDDGWIRGSVELPEGTRIDHAAVDNGRIIAALSPFAPDDTGDPVVAVFTFDSNSVGWRESQRLPLPPTDERVLFVGLRGGQAFASISRGGLNAGPIHLFLQDSPDAPWRLEFTIDGLPDRAGSPYHPPPSLSGDILAVATQCWECPRDGSCDHSLAIWRRASAGVWEAEADLAAPTLPRPAESPATWDAMVYLPGRIAAVATSLDHSVVFLLSRSRSGVWESELELTNEPPAGLIPARFGGHIAFDGDRLIATTVDPFGNLQQMELLERTRSGWCRAGVIDPPDRGFGDDLTAPVLSGNHLIVGAPRHDAAGIDAGAAYILDLTRWEPVEYTESVESGRP